MRIIQRVAKMARTTRTYIIIEIITIHITSSFVENGTGESLASRLANTAAAALLVTHAR